MNIEELSALTRQAQSDAESARAITELIQEIATMVNQAVQKKSAVEYTARSAKGARAKHENAAEAAKLAEAAKQRCMQTNDMTEAGYVKVWASEAEKYKKQLEEVLGEISSFQTVKSLLAGSETMRRIDEAKARFKTEPAATQQVALTPQPAKTQQVLAKAQLNAQSQQAQYPQGQQQTDNTIPSSASRLPPSPAGLTTTKSSVNDESLGRFLSEYSSGAAAATITRQQQHGQYAQGQQAPQQAGISSSQELWDEIIGGASSPAQQQTGLQAPQQAEASNAFIDMDDFIDMDVDNSIDLIDILSSLDNEIMNRPLSEYSSGAAAATITGQQQQGQQPQSQYYPQDQQAQFVQSQQVLYPQDMQAQYAQSQQALYPQDMQAQYAQSQQALYPQGLQAQFAQSQQALYPQGQQSQYYPQDQQAQYAQSQQALYPQGQQSQYYPQDQQAQFVQSQQALYPQDMQAQYYPQDQQAQFAQSQQALYSQGQQSQYYPQDQQAQFVQSQQALYPQGQQAQYYPQDQQAQFAQSQQALYPQDMQAQYAQGQQAQYYPQDQQAQYAQSQQALYPQGQQTQYAQGQQQIDNTIPSSPSSPTGLTATLRNVSDVTLNKFLSEYSNGAAAATITGQQQQAQYAQGQQELWDEAIGGALSQELWEEIIRGPSSPAQQQTDLQASQQAEESNAFIDVDNYIEMSKQTQPAQQIPQVSGQSPLDQLQSFANAQINSLRPPGQTTGAAAQQLRQGQQAAAQKTQQGPSPAKRSR